MARAAGEADDSAGDGDAGIYALLIRVGARRTLEAGALGSVELRRGYYAYVGRASRGLAARLRRHARREGKRLFWHVDHLLASARLSEIWVFPLSRGECELADELERGGGRRDGLRGFGSSDCRCRGHLLYLGARRPVPPAGALLVITDLEGLG